MSASHTDVDQFPTVVVVSNGDPAAQEAWRDADEPLADRTYFLRRRVAGAEMGDEVECDLPAAATSAWVFGGAGSALALNQDSAATASLVFIKLPLPKRCVLKSVHAVLAGATGHGGLPGAMPKIDLFRQDVGSTGSPVSLGTDTDGSAGVAGYETPHTLEITGLSEAVEHDSGSSYYVRVTGEAGANAVAGLAVLRLYAIVNPA